MKTSYTGREGSFPFQCVLLDDVLLRLNFELPCCYEQKARNIVSQLEQGVPYLLLGGIKVRKAAGLIRFKIGRDHRLICKQTDSGLVPYKLVTRQAFERELVRRR